MATADTLTVETEAPCYYWGEKGEYGPFHELQTGIWEGWPHPGEVMRYFRNKAGYSQEEFAAIYQKAIGNPRPITRRQVNRMEQYINNEFPEEISRRKAISDILSIPPALVGLAAINNVKLLPKSIGTTQAQTLIKVSVDLEKYQRTVQVLTSLQYTSNAFRQITQIQREIQELENLESQARGNLLYQIQELLFTYNLLASKVTRDQRQFTQSYHHANHMVRVAKASQDSDLIATAYYIRGRTRLTWGRAGTLETGVYKVQRDKIQKAIEDFTRAKAIKNLHPQLTNLIDIYTSWAKAILIGEKAHSPVLITLDNIGENLSNQEKIDDPYTQMLITGSRIGIPLGEYLNMRATILNTIGEPYKALESLKEIKSLTEGKIGAEYTSHQAWIQTVEAHSLIKIKEYGKATKLARTALHAYSDLNNIDGIADIKDIYGRLSQSPYKDYQDVEVLRDQLRIYTVHNTHQTEEQDY